MAESSVGHRRLATITDRLQRRKWEQLLSHAEKDGSAIMQVYMSDGWSCSMSTSMSIHTPDGKRLRRERRERTEWLLERQILRTLSPASVHGFAVLISEPTILGGKNGWHIWSAAAKSQSILRRRVRTGIVQQIYLQDGLHRSNFAEKMQARFDLYYFDNLDSLEPQDLIALEMQDWMWSFWCISHIMSLGVRWGLAEVIVRKDLIDDVHLCISSLHNSSAALLHAVELFVAQRTRYRAGRSGADTRKQFWLLCGVPPDFLENVCQVDPWYDRDLECLWVDASMANERDHIATISSVLFFFMRWINFSDARWGGVGPSTRSWTGSAGVGIDYVGKMVVADKGANHHHIGGYARFGKGDVRTFMIVAAISSWCTEAAITMLLEDDRAIRLWPDLKREMQSEREFLETLPFFRVGACSFSGHAARTRWLYTQGFVLECNAYFACLLHAQRFRSAGRGTIEFVPWRYRHEPGSV